MSYDWNRRKGDYLFADRSTNYRICARCIMDTSDSEIVFDEHGVCSHCQAFAQAMKTCVFTGEDARQRLEVIVEQIKREGHGKRYDSILGLSGGVDSSYTAHVVAQYGLRPLAVHMDNGWNSEQAVRNVENIVKKLSLDLHTEVLDWDEFKNLQLAFLRASTPDSEIPTDHAIVATLYKLAAKFKVRWLPEGSNVATEMMVPATWSHGHSDWRYIRNLNDMFGGRPLKTYPHYTYFDYLVKLPKIQKIARFPILNYLPYQKTAAMDVLKREFGWEYYGGKHYESIYTRFYQGYILPVKFGFDKRRSHISCLINNGELTREDALREIEKPAIEPQQLREDRAFVLKKFGLTEREFEDIMALPRKTFWDYPSYERDFAASLEGRFYYFWTGFPNQTRHHVKRALLLAKRVMCGAARRLLRVPGRGLYSMYRAVRSVVLRSLRGRT